ncbi:hypothetical protein C922_03647 [Plasmodium inui San Antonio 1]|uniref:Surface protein P113 n=1 Tax=Plasmodium inui San Antonio 1 TaxID=1237626 RepID=W7A3K3_9APIC|nr:hypothetical protein C922_03647 [Plasmodium inui San Antonio 1]EUD65923.1 hypothetical protein C922_03647 [Plasmodium inui San Antonio 1]
MKFPPLCRIPLALLLLCLMSRTRCYVHNDLIKFGEENSLKCSQGSLYILHCEVKCLNDKNRIIHRSCIDEVEAKCMGNRKCKYYFDYVMKRKAHNLGSKNEIEIEECIESEKNEIKTSTTCLLSESFLLDENYIQYFFFIKNKNEEPISCKDGNLNVKSAILHFPFCKIHLKDVTNVLKRQCDNNQECVINPYVLQKDALNEKDQCYLNNSYVSLNVVCTKESEEQSGDSSQKEQRDDGLEEEKEGNYDIGLDRSQGGGVAYESDETDAFNKDDELRKTNEEVDLIMNSNESFTNKIKKAKTILLSEMNQQTVKKNAIFKKLGKELSKMIVNRYDPSDLKDLLEDRYNEMRRSPDQDLYYLYLLDTLDINIMEDVDIRVLQDNLGILLKEQMEKLNHVEKNINRLRKKYLSIYNKAKNNDMKGMFDENVDPVLTYDDFAHGNGMISADIFFKYKPTIKPLKFSESKVSDTDKGVSKKKQYKDILEMETLDDYNRKKRIIDMRNGLVEILKKLYYEKNGIFNNLASCIKSYCYKNPMDLNMLSDVLKINFENLKEKKISDPVSRIVSYLDKVGSQTDSPVDNSSQVGAAEPVGGTPRWEKNKRILQKLKALLHLGYQQAYDKELEIDERTEKYTALNEKAKEYNLDRLFTESDKVLKKVAVLTSAKESANEVFGNQASIFDVYNEEEVSSGKGGADSQKGEVSSDKGEVAADQEKMNKGKTPKKVERSNLDEQEDNENDKNYPDEGYESGKENGNNTVEKENNVGNVESVEEKGEKQKDGESEDADGVNAGSNKESDSDEVDQDGGFDDAGSTDGSDHENDQSHKEDDGLLEGDLQKDKKEEAAEGELAPKEEAAKGELAPKEEAAEGEVPPKDDTSDRGSTDSTAADEAATDTATGEVAQPAETDQNDVPITGEESNGAEDAAKENRDEAQATDQPTEEAVVKGDSDEGESDPKTKKNGDEGGSIFQGMSRILLAVLAILSLKFFL